MRFYCQPSLHWLWLWSIIHLITTIVLMCWVAPGMWVVLAVVFLLWHFRFGLFSLRGIWPQICLRHVPDLPSGQLKLAQCVDQTALVIACCERDDGAVGGVYCVGRWGPWILLNFRWTHGLMQCHWLHPDAVSARVYSQCSLLIAQQGLR